MIDVVINIVVFLLCLGVLVLVHEWGHFVFARLFGVRVDRFSIGFGKPIFRLGKDKKGTEYVLAPIPLGGYVEMAGESPATSKGLPDEFISKPLWKRTIIVMAGPLINYLFGFLIFWLIYSLGAPELLPVVGKVLDDSPAQRIGLQKGDKIVEVNGVKVDLWDEMREIISKHPQEEIVLKVQRDGRLLSIKVIPEAKEITDRFGVKQKMGLIGITPDISAYAQVRFPIHVAFMKAGEKVLEVTKGVFRAIVLLVSGNKQVREAVAGPIGIYEITSQARTVGVNVLLLVLAMLSVSLAIFNLLPIPMLDGGHLVMFLIEAFIRRPIPDRVYEYTAHIGMTLIIIMTVLVIYNDIRKLTDGFHRQGVSNIVSAEKIVPSNIP